jgi:MFS family permease
MALLDCQSMTSPTPPDFAPRRYLAAVFTVEALGAVGANLLMFGIFFYMQRRFGWGARRNLILSSAQGAAYIVGALAANPLSARFDRRMLLGLFQVVLALLALVGVCFAASWAAVCVAFFYTAFSAAQWPLLESLFSAGASPVELSRRISIYNLVWSGTGAVTVAVCGLIIVHIPQGIFVVTVAAHLASLALILRTRAPIQISHAQLAPDPQLLPMRTLAKRLSRIALPATFAVIYAMGAIMPTLPVIQSTSPEYRTLLASVWMISRWFCFLFLGATVWWHTRPRAMLIAAIVQFAAFLAITLVPSALSMILWQIGIGIAMGMIYAASLYFGMVLSDGSTAQNAYHEALIGLGSILGPGCGALASTFSPGNPHASITAVGIILWISVLTACWVSLQSRGRRAN